MISPRTTLALVASTALAVAIGCRRDEPPPGGSAASAGSTGPSATPPSRDVAFVDDAGCATCHPFEFERWRGSHHDLAMDPATEETVLGDFEDAVFERAGVASRFFRRDGGFFVHTAGPDGELTDHRIEYTFGVHPLQQYLVRFPGGRLQCLTIAWDVERERWFDLYPDEEIGHDDPLHWTGRYQSWNVMCADCHSTDLRKGYDLAADTYDTTWREIDVGCQACHGPGGDHIRWARQRAAGAVQAGEATGLVVDLRRYGAHEQLNACAPCHSRRYRLRTDYEFGAEFLDFFVPERLHEGYYHADGQVLEEVYVYGSFVQSKMGMRGVACSDCHDPHALELLAPGNGVCTQCHTTSPPTDRFPTLVAKEYDTLEHHFHAEGTEGALCVSCHMPARTYMVIDPRRDHSFRIPRPDLTVALGTPNACQDCHADQTADWAAERIAEWSGTDERPRHYGEAFAAARAGRAEAVPGLLELAADVEQPPIVRATALELLPRAGPSAFPALAAAIADDDALVRMAALRGLGDVERLPVEVLLPIVAPLLDDPVRAVRVEAGRVLAAVPPASLPEERRAPFDAALAEFRTAQLAQADMPWPHLNLGVVHLARGETEAALDAYRTALRLDPTFLPVRFNLANALNGLGRNDEAERVLRDGVARYPDEGELFYSLGLLLAEMGKPAEAAEALGRAGVLMPGRARVHYNHGLILQGLDRSDEAEPALLLALKEADRDTQVLHALALFYIDREQWERALPYAERFAELVPGAPVPQQLVARIRGELERR